MRPSSSAAVPQTHRNTSSGTADRRDSSSRGSASGIAELGRAECGWITYSHPVAARTTANEEREPTATRAALATSKPPARGEQRRLGVAAPECPVVAAGQRLVLVRNVLPRELA